MKLPDFGKLTLRLFGAVTRTEHLLMQEFKVPAKSKLRGKTKTDIVRDSGVVIVGMKSPKQKRYNINVGFHQKVKSGNLLIMGTNKQLSEFQKQSKRK